MFTLNALCLASLDQLLEYVFDLRERDPNPHTHIDTSFNILRFPSLQSITTLPEHIKQERHEHYSQWMVNNQERMYPHEVPGMQRLLSYIEGVSEGHTVRAHSDLSTRQLDFHNFFAQYDRRRGKNFAETFADWPALVEWFEEMRENDNRNQIDELVTGDATEWGAEIFQEVIERHKDDT
jgi:hypothetical protein